jgi:hypothetical protein
LKGHLLSGVDRQLFYGGFHLMFGVVHFMEVS